MLKAIIYDFDGVICDSVDVKTRAFAEMYSSYGDDVVKKVMDYHHANGGISRYEKIKYYHRELLKLNITESELNTLAEQFAGLAKEKVVNAPFIPGALSFLKKNYKNYLQFICTGTPEQEMKEIAERKDLNQYLKEIYGSPKKKPEIIKLIMSNYNFLKEEIVFFGDAMTDYDAATELSIRFIGIKSTHTTFPSGTEILENFNHLKL